MARLLDVKSAWNLSRDTFLFRGLQCWGIECVSWKLVMWSGLILNKKRLSFLAFGDGSLDVSFRRPLTSCSAHDMILEVPHTY